MALSLIAASDAYRRQIVEMLEEFRAHGGLLSPSNVFSHDWNDFPAYIEALGDRGDKPGRVPSTTYFVYDDVRDRVVGAVNIRHNLNEGLTRVGGHIGHGVRPSDRGHGIGTAAIKLALDRCRALGLRRVLITCDDENKASARTIEKNGGVLDAPYLHDHGLTRRYWIDLD